MDSEIRLVRRRLWLLATPGMFSLAAAWLALVTVTATLKPEHVRVVTLYGIAGFLWWLAASPMPSRDRIQRLLQRAALILAFYVPISNTWVPRILRDIVLDLPSRPWASVALPGTVLAVVSAAVLLFLRRRSSIAGLGLPPVVRYSGWFIAAGAVVSTLVSVDVPVSLGASIASVFAPICAFAVAACLRRDAAHALEITKAIAFASLIPLATGVMSILEGFGTPLAVVDLLRINMNLGTYEGYGIATFGNARHMVAFFILVAPLQAILVVNPAQTAVTRFVAAIGLSLGIANLLLTYTRAGMAAGALLLFLLVLRSWRWNLRGAAALAMLTLPLAVVLLHPLTISRYVDFARMSPMVRRHQDLLITEASGVERWEAVKQGLLLASEKGLLGSGMGTYPKLDPVHTAAHNLLLHSWVEGGILFLAGLALLSAHILRRAVALFLAGFRGEGAAVECSPALAASVACGTFVLFGFVAGCPLILQGFPIWAMMFALILGLGAGQEAGGPGDSHGD